MFLYFYPNNHIAANNFNIIYSSDFRSLLEAGGVDRLMTITRQRQRFTPRVVKFASQVLYSMWVHQDLRETYRKAGWKEADFVTKTVRRIYHTLYLQILLSDKNRINLTYFTVSQFMLILGSGKKRSAKFSNQPKFYFEQTNGQPKRNKI